MDVDLLHDYELHEHQQLERDLTKMMNSGIEKNFENFFFKLVTCVNNLTFMFR